MGIGVKKVTFCVPLLSRGTCGGHTIPDLHRPGAWSPRPPLAAPTAGGRGTSFLYFGLVVKVYMLWCIVGVAGATSGQIYLPQLYSHIYDDLHGGVLELMTTFACQSFRSAAWSSRRYSELARSISRRVAGLPWRAKRGSFSGARMLARRWWICSSLTSSMGGGGAWSKWTQGRLLVDVPQRHVPCCVQRVCSSTHKSSLTMVFSWMWQRWMLGFPSDVRLDGAGVGWRPLASVVAWKHRNRFVFLDLLWFFLPSFQDNYFISVISDLFW
jgi:hypothetical protein